MTDQAAPQPGAADEPRSILRLRDERKVTAYSNFTVASPTPEEVSILFGVHLLPSRQPNEVEVETSHRIIMTWPSAKRLAIALGNLIQRHEAAHGVVSVQVQMVGAANNAAKKE